MSDDRNYMGKTLLDALFNMPQYRSGPFLDINKLDDLDPVHLRSRKNPEREFDYDADMGREHEDAQRANGRRRSSAVAGSFVQIADALPVIESPSIAAEMPDDVPAHVSKTDTAETQ